MNNALLVTSIWFVLWWMYAIYDVFFSQSHEIIPDRFLGLRLDVFTRNLIKVLVFPLYVLYHCIVILFKFIHYLCVDLLFELILMGLLRIIGLVFKGIFIFLKRAFD